VNTLPQLYVIFDQPLTCSSCRFYNIQIKEKTLEFLNKRIKPNSDDPDEKWITTWNDYLGRLKFFFRWLYNYKIKRDEEHSKILEDMEE
jgi:hypothetical protein